MKHAGFAPLAYYDGLWHYRCNHESLGRLLWRRMPYLPLVLARLHHRWDNRATYSNREFLRALAASARALKKRLPKSLLRLFSKPPACVSQSVAVNDATPQAPPSPSPKIVDGVWSDNRGSARTCAVRPQSQPTRRPHSTHRHSDRANGIDDCRQRKANRRVSPARPTSGGNRVRGRTRSRAQPGGSRSSRNTLVDAAGLQGYRSCFKGPISFPSRIWRHRPAVGLRLLVHSLCAPRSRAPLERSKWKTQQVASVRALLRTLRR